VLEPGGRAAWRTAAHPARRRRGTDGAARDELRGRYEAPAATWHSGAWTASRTILLTDGAPGGALRPRRDASRARHPDGLVFRCDQRDMTAFRASTSHVRCREAAGASTTDRRFALMPEPGGERARLPPRLARLGGEDERPSRTASPRRSSPSRDAAAVTDDLAGVDASRAAQVRNDATLKVWLPCGPPRGDDRGAVRLRVGRRRRARAGRRGTLQESRRVAAQPSS
jgi:hypothetical protein